MEIFHPENTKEIAKRRKTNTKKRKEKQYFYKTSPLENYEKGNNKNQLQQIFHLLPSEQENNPSKVQPLFGRQQKRERNY